MGELLKEGPRYKFKDLTFWASNGLIYIEDQKDGEFVVLTADEAFERAKQMAEELPYMKYYKEQMELLDGIQKVADCVKDAKDQGDPMSEDVRREKAREIKRSRGGSKMILPTGIIPGAADSFEKMKPEEIAKRAPRSRSKS